jgi:hypothetical protein
MVSEIERRELEDRFPSPELNRNSGECGLRKVWELNDNYSINTGFAGEWMAYRQFANQVEQFTLKFQVNVLLPQLDE